MSENCFTCIFNISDTPDKECICDVEDNQKNIKPSGMKYECVRYLSIEYVGDIIRNYNGFKEGKW